MRTLNDVFTSQDIHSALQTAAAVSGRTLVQEPGRVIAVVYNISTAVTTADKAVTFDKNNVAVPNSGAVIPIGNIYTSGVAAVSPPIDVVAGDTLEMVATGAAGAGGCRFLYVVRR